VTSLLDVDSRDVRLRAPSLAALARAAMAAAGAATSADALGALAEAAQTVSGAEIALVRALDDSGERLEAVAVAAPRALAAELYGTVLPVRELPEATLDDLARAPDAVRRIARHTGATRLLLAPARGDGVAVSVELLGSGEPFSAEQKFAAELCAAQAALVLRAFAAGGGASSLARPALELAGEALAVALQEQDAAAEVVRLAAGVVGASASVLWESREEGLVPAASWGVEAAADLAPAREIAERALEEPGPGPVSAQANGLPQDCAVSTTLPLGRPPLGVLQLFHPAGEEPEAEQLTRLATFGVRAAHALRTGERARLLALELERTRALLDVIVQATAELSVSHTLETAVERVAELLGVGRVAVYLRGAGGELEQAASRGLAGPHARVADRLLDLALGPSRQRTVLEVPDITQDPRLAPAAAAARESGIGSALAVPLTARGEVVGLLAAYPEGRPAAGEHETALLAALAGQLAVAVQNAQLHEQATLLGQEREAALAAERAAARQIRALYEVSRSFAQSLRLDETLDALARTIVEVLDLDAAVVRMPDERREQLLPRAVHIREAPFAEAVRTILAQPVPFGQRNVQRLFRERRPFRLGRGRSRGEQFLPALVPFLEKGWTAAVVPVALPTEVVASLGVFSFRPGNPLSQETVEAAIALAGQAALAIDNARLYQQQKQFADTMQRSLLPRSRPVIEGLEVGEVYEPSARVDVGGDLYDFLALEDGRLAVVLGDVTGHGVDATADMAMAKFVFRSLAREHPEPADFLAAANDVICSEIATGKFISMSYVVVDGASGRVAGASAGHPAPRIVLPDASTRPLEAHGLVLGIDGGQEYTESQAELPVGASLVLYTDGVVEARRKGELYGDDRLDALLAQQHELSARALATAVAEDAREFAGGDLSDDLAVVVIRRI
jgi:serine phosphatase RsbU (regulator of sigma subunit)